MDVESDVLTCHVRFNGILNVTGKDLQTRPKGRQRIKCSVCNITLYTKRQLQQGPNGTRQLTVCILTLRYCVENEGMMRGGYMHGKQTRTQNPSGERAYRIMPA